MSPFTLRICSGGTESASDSFLTTPATPHAVQAPKGSPSEHPLEEQLERLQRGTDDLCQRSRKTRRDVLQLIRDLRHALSSCRKRFEAGGPQDRIQDVAAKMHPMPRQVERLRRVPKHTRRPGLDIRNFDVAHPARAQQLPDLLQRTVRVGHVLEHRPIEHEIEGAGVPDQVAVRDETYR